MSKNPLAGVAGFVQRITRRRRLACSSRFKPLLTISIMNRMLAPLRGTATVITVSLAIAGTSVYGAPKKTAPVVQPAPEVVPAAPKKGIFSKAKDLLTFKKKDQPAAEVAAPKPASVKKAKSMPAPAPVAKGKTKTTVAPTPVEVPATVAKKTPSAGKSKTARDAKMLPVEQPVAQAAPPKKGWIKGLFSKSKPETPAPAAGPQLANAKTAKPTPVKDVKSAAKPDITVSGSEPEPKEKRGFLGFFRKLREPIPDSPEFTVADAGKIERPADWQEHKIVSDNRTAIYSFGPTQANGPDRRLESGTVVKVKSVRRGWALVEVEGGFAGYMDASALRDAAKGDFKDPPPPPTMMASTGTPDYWAPLAPPPDLPDQPSKGDSESALLLLPPLELEPKPNP